MDRHRVVRLCAGALLASVVAGAPPLPAQGTGKRTGEQIQASFDAHKGEFDYLLGDWEFTGTNQQYGKIRGYWSAARLDKGQILDEYRAVGDKGETYYVTTTLRNYNGGLDRWDLVGADAGRGLQDVGTGHWESGEMRIEQTFGVAAGTPSLWRIRYHDIGPDRFSWTADRSMDGGKTWVTHFQELEARRIAPARSMGPLTTVNRKASASPTALTDERRGSAAASPPACVWKAAAWPPPPRTAAPSRRRSGAATTGPPR